MHALASEILFCDGGGLVHSACLVVSALEDRHVAKVRQFDESDARVPHFVPCLGGVDFPGETRKQPTGKAKETMNQYAARTGRPADELQQSYLG